MNNSLWLSRMKHPFHIVDPRPWPAISTVGVFYLLSGIVCFLHRYGWVLLLIGILIILSSTAQWWRDINREATLQGKHRRKVEDGLRIGMILFIVREVFFFLSFFWAFFHSSLRPVLDWPPRGIAPIRPFQVPLLNTVLLLTRGATITWGHIALLVDMWQETYLRLACTVWLGMYFTYVQALEYDYTDLSIWDSVYGSTFYIATGFHGVHVFIGTIFIGVILNRHMSGHFSGRHHFGFEARAWYWHFVDVVWLFLFLCVYWWGS